MYTDDQNIYSEEEAKKELPEKKLPEKKLPKEIGEPVQRLALHILNKLCLVPEHVERRSLRNPAYPEIVQVSCFIVILLHLFIFACVCVAIYMQTHT